MPKKNRNKRKRRTYLFFNTLPSSSIWLLCFAVNTFVRGTCNTMKLVDDDPVTQHELTYNFRHDGEQQWVVFFDNFDCRHVSCTDVRRGGGVRRYAGCEHLQAMSTIKIIISNKLQNIPLHACQRWGQFILVVVRRRLCCSGLAVGGRGVTG